MSQLFYDEQAKAVEKLTNSRGGILWWRVGTGKTRIGIKVFESLFAHYAWGFPTICAVILKPAAFLDFRFELDKLGMDCVILEDNLNDIPEEVQFAMLQKPTFLLISCGKITKSVTPLLVDRRVKFAIVDELYLYKNPKSQRSQMIQKLCLRVKAVGLSGSIMTAQKIEDIYGQLQAVQKHRHVAPNLTAFRGEFMNMRMNETKHGRKFPFRFPKPGAYKAIMERCADTVDVYFPPKNERKVHMQTLKVEATPEQKKLFYDLKTWFEAEEFGLELDNTLQVALKIQQIANGWVQDENGVYRKVPSDKVKRVIDLAQDLIEQGETLIIWCAFRADVTFLRRAFAEAEIATLQFMSGEPFDVETWKKGEVKVVVATEAMGVSVNHFDQVAYACYFSMDYKWLNLQQSMGRTDRRSSLHTECFYYFIQVADSLDADIYNRVLNSRNRELTLVQIGEGLRDWIRKR